MLKFDTNMYMILVGKNVINVNCVYDKKLALVANGTKGYYVNDITASNPAASNTDGQMISSIDKLYIWARPMNVSVSVWLASPVSYISLSDYILEICSNCYIQGDRNGPLQGATNIDSYSCTRIGVRPVVCLKSNIPAKVGTGDYDFELVK